MLHFERAKIPVIFCAIFIFLEPLTAHTIYLKSGRKLVGKIIDQNKSEILFEMRGKKITVLKSNVDQVDYFDHEEPVQKKPAVVKKPVVEKKSEKIEEVSKPWGLNRWTIAGRSSLIPGWGHYATDHSYYAATYLGLTVVSLAYVASTRSTALKAESNYSSSANTISLVTYLQIASGTNVGVAFIGSMFAQAGPYNEYQSKVTAYNNSLGILSLIYLGQLAHAFYTGMKHEELEAGKMAADKKTSLFSSPDLKWNIVSLPEPGSGAGKPGTYTGLSFRMQF